MEIVNLLERDLGVSAKYNAVPQPMYIYHSTEELYENVEHPSIISNVFEFIEYVKANNYLTTKGKGKYEWFNLIDDNIWIATKEKHIPATMDKHGNITYKLNDKEEKIPTDNCYIRLYSILSMRTSFILYTSSGMHNASLISWQPSAAVKDMYDKVMHHTVVKKTYDEKLDNMLEKRKATVRDMKFLMLLLNPLSPSFLDIDKSMAKAMPDIRKADRKKYLKTERFVKLFINQLEKLMPDLIKGVQQKNTPDEIGEYIAKMRELALDRGTVDDQIKALNVTLKLGYGKQMLHTSNDLSALADNKFTPLMISESDRVLTNDTDPLMHQTLVQDEKDDESDTGDLPPESATELETYDDADVKMNDEEYREAMDETGGIDAFVMDDKEEE